MFNARPFLSFALITPFVLVTGPALQAQKVIHILPGESTLDLAGFAVSDAGDVDLDGVPDVIVGAPTAQTDGDPPPEGKARVFSGADGSVLLDLPGQDDFGLFGHSVGSVGDVNSDGHADLLVGAPAGPGVGGDPTGVAFLFSGKDGALLLTFLGDEIDSLFGWSVHGTGDVDGDGTGDLVIGAPAASPNGPASGLATVYSGLTGDPILSFAGAFPGAQLGTSVGAAGDVNGDGRQDIVVGAPLDIAVFILTGSARVYSGLDGSQLHLFVGDDFFDEFGHSVSGAGDVDADGLSDVVVGMPFGGGVGRARVYSGSSGAQLIEVSGAVALERFGFSVSDAGDTDDDGHADIVIGSPFANGLGAAVVVLGSNGSVSHMLSGSGPTDQFGHSVSGAGDVDGNGYADQVVGSPFEDLVAFDSGAARIFAGCEALAEGYGEGCPGASGVVPSLDAQGCPVKANRVILTVSGGVPNEFGVVLFGAGPAQIPMENGCFLLASPLLKPVLVFVLDFNGEATFDETIDPEHASGTFVSQAFVSDPGTPQGFANTNGVEFVIP